MRENQKGPSPIGSFDALHSQAVAALSSGRLADAEHLSQKALEIRPNDVGTLNVLGQALLNQRRPAEAAEVFIRTLQRSRTFTTIFPLPIKQSVDWIRQLPQSNKPSS